MKSVCAVRCISLLTLVAALATSAFAGIPSVPVPIITFLSPVSAHPGAADFTLTVNGANFVNGGSTVNWNGTPLATTFVSSDQLTATVPAAKTTSGGTGWITVSNSICGSLCGPVSLLTSNVFYFPVISATSTYNAAQIATTVGNGPLDLAAGDFNNDGKLDLAVANVSDSTVSILLGNGDGTFQPQTTLSSFVEPFGIAVGDLNGDGILDLVVGNDSGEGGLNIFLGNGSGGFTAVTFVNGGNCLLEPVLADLNRDGKLDIVVGDECGSRILVFLGNGDGTFGSPITVSATGQIFGIAVADFNGDGILDIAATNYNNNTVDIYLGVGDGTFGAATLITNAFDLISLAAGDFNGDGKVDLLGADEGGNTGGIYLLYGNGDGTFQTPVVVAGAGDSYFSVATGDLNGDGNLDIIGTSTGGLLQIGLSTEEGRFSPLQALGNVSVTFEMAVGNFATGGGLDIATYGSGNQILVFLPTVVISPSTQDFGTVAVGARAQQMFTITNDASNTVTISGITFTGSNPDDFSQTNTCSSPLATSATCTVTVTFTPATSAVFSAVLTVADDAPATPQTASLTGTGIAAPIASLSPTTLTFGNQTIGTTSASQSVTLSNTGNATLNLAPIAITGTNNADFAQTNNCQAMLSPASQCTITVTFTPSIASAESASLQFTDDAAGSPQSVALSATGVSVPPSYSITANPTSLTIVQGQSGRTTLTVTQMGGITGTVTFSCTGLPAKSSCVFAPAEVVMSGNDAPATVMLTVNTTGSNGVISQLQAPLFLRTSFSANALFILPAAFMFLVPVWLKKPTKRRGLHALLGLLLLLGAFGIIGMTACGDNASKATPVGQYSANVVASVTGSNSQSTIVSITITR